MASSRMLEVKTVNSDGSVSDEKSPEKRRDLLIRRPSYRKILNELGEVLVLPTDNAISSDEGGQESRTTITKFNATSECTVVQRVQYLPVEQQFFVPVVAQGSENESAGEGEARKRAMQRKLKNREAARECRRKKKEYVYFLEGRVVLLENQNKALTDELKALKERYFQQETERDD